MFSFLFLHDGWSDFLCVTSARCLAIQAKVTANRQSLLHWWATCQITPSQNSQGRRMLGAATSGGPHFTCPCRKVAMFLFWEVQNGCHLPLPLNQGWHYRGEQLKQTNKTWLFRLSRSLLKPLVLFNMYSVIYLFKEDSDWSQWKKIYNIVMPHSKLS